MQLATWAQRTDGWTGAQLENLCREAGLLALRENINATGVSHAHFTRAAGDGLGLNSLFGTLALS